MYNVFIVNSIFILAVATSFSLVTASYSSILKEDEFNKVAKVEFVSAEVDLFAYSDSKESCYKLSFDFPFFK